MYRQQGVWYRLSEDAEALKAANGLNGLDLEGRTLLDGRTSNVNEARPIEDRPRTDRPGGAGGRRRSESRCLPGEEKDSRVGP